MFKYMEIKNSNKSIIYNCLEVKTVLLLNERLIKM